MRVSTSMIFNSGVGGMRDLQSGLYKLQNQLATGRRILTPADDPIGAAEALKVTQGKNVNERFIENQGQASSKLAFAETKLQGVQEELKAIYERGLQAGNGSYSDEQKAMIATELKQRMESLIGLANTRDGAGEYIFAGYKSTTEPFTRNTAATPPYSLALDGSSMKYYGDAGKPALSVSASRDMAVGENGLDVFMQVRDASGNVTGESVFDSVQNMIDILDPASGVPYTQAAYNQALGGIMDSLDHMNTVRASIGSRLKALDDLKSSAEDVNLNYEMRLSELQDLDWLSAISSFTQHKMQLDAAQTTFQQTSQMSLFSML